jgi:hypothetical protein
MLPTEPHAYLQVREACEAGQVLLVGQQQAPQAQAGQAGQGGQAGCVQHQAAADDPTQAEGGELQGRGGREGLREVSCRGGKVGREGGKGRQLSITAGIMYSVAAGVSCSGPKVSKDLPEPCMDALECKAVLLAPWWQRVRCSGYP